MHKYINPLHRVIYLKRYQILFEHTLHVLYNTMYYYSLNCLIVAVNIEHSFIFLK